MPMRKRWPGAKRRVAEWAVVWYAGYKIPHSLRIPMHSLAQCPSYVTDWKLAPCPLGFGGGPSKLTTPVFNWWKWCELSIIWCLGHLVRSFSEGNELSETISRFINICAKITRIRRGLELDTFWEHPLWFKFKVLIIFIHNCKKTGMAVMPLWWFYILLLSSLSCFICICY